VKNTGFPEQTFTLLPHAVEACPWTFGLVKSLMHTLGFLLFALAQEFGR
jgi:hypothetical protein